MKNNTEQTSPSRNTKESSTSVKKSNKKIYIIIGIVVFFLFILPAILLTIVFGYVAHRGGDKIVEDIAKSQGVDVDLNSKNGSVQLKDKDGNQFSSKAGKELPDDFPRDSLELYSKNYTNSSRIKIGENVSWSIVIETQDSPQMITKKIKEQLAAKSWVIQTESNSDDYNMVIAKKDPYSAIINYQSEKGKTSITYVISKTDSNNQ